MGLKFSNFGKAIVSSAPDGTTGLSFSVEAGKGLLYPPLGTGDYFYGIFKDASGNREIVKIEARATDAMTIATGGRGLDGTEARTWAAGDYFVAGLVNIALEESLSNENLAAFGALTGSDGKLPSFTGEGTMSLVTTTAFGRSLMDDPDAEAGRTTLGIPTAIAALIPSDTTMLFYEAAAPTGWTQVTSYNNYALRIVSGSGTGGGGTVDFSTAFTSKAVTGSIANHTLTSGEIPSHYHAMPSAMGGNPGGSIAYAGNTGSYSWTQVTGATGGGGGHNHTFTGTAINLAVKYLNTILATKD